MAKRRVTKETPKRWLPRVYQGCDYGARRQVLAVDTVRGRYLVWLPGRMEWKNRLEGYTYHQTELATWTEGRHGMPSVLQEGGRLSRKVIERHAKAINDFFGFCVASNLSVKWTVVLDRA